MPPDLSCLQVVDVLSECLDRPFTGNSEIYVANCFVQGIMTQMQ